MVFGINPPTSGANTFAAFQQLALHSNATANTTAGGNSTGAGAGGNQGSGGQRTAGHAMWGVAVLGAVGVAFL